MNKTGTNKLIRIALLAAVIASFLAVGAYAAGFLGKKAIVIDEPAVTDGSALVSISQPQSAPEELDEVARKIENAKAAWSEWRTWRETSPDLPREPAVFLPPADNVSSTYVDNPDGGYTIYFHDNESFQKMLAATPMHTSMLMVLWERIPTIIQRMIMAESRAIMMRHAIIPSSSPATEKIKSVCLPVRALV